MSKFIKMAVMFSVVINLTACLEVKDKNNEKVAEALAEQKTTISLSGTVNDLSTGNKAINATVKIKVGNTFSDPVAVTNGTFLLENLPADSDYELVVHSTTNTFLDRAIFGTTRATNTPGKVYEDIGTIAVAAGVEYKFSILDSATSKPVTNLLFQGSSSIGLGTNSAQYLHKATYDPTIQQYKIILPEKLNIAVTASLDVNNDGTVEYAVVSMNTSSSYISIDENQLVSGSTTFLSDLHANKKVELRFSIIDSTGISLIGAMPIIQDELNGNLVASYDSAAQQYVFNIVIGNGVSVFIPSFSVAGSKYDSSSISISLSNNQFSIGPSFNPTVYQSLTGADKEVINTALKLSASTQLQVPTVVASALDPVSNSFKIFYSSPIVLKTSSVHLYQKNNLKIVQGGDSITDSVPSGITTIEYVDKNVDVDAALSLNNTLLTITPKSTLPEGYSYAYQIDNLVDSLSNTDFSQAADDITFSLAPTQPFNINDVKLDNNNFNTVGGLIRPYNTAGQVPYYPAMQNSVYLCFPASISTLKSLRITSISATQDNVVSARSNSIDAVSSSSLFNVNQVLAVMVAYNESVSSSLSILKGTALTNGSWYVAYTGDYMNDNTIGNTNSITFTYSFETKTGVVETGNITLPVN